MSFYHRYSVRPKKHMPLAVALKRSFYGGGTVIPGLAMAATWKKPNAERWERGFAALCRFRKREGHCWPSRHHMEGNFPLGDWVSSRRYRKDVLPLERKRRLDAIGFVWDWRDHLWEQGFAALLKFKRREGQCCVPISRCRPNGGGD
jgi:Helicase associated domain